MPFRVTRLYVQLGLTDRGLEQYYVDVDYYRADIVKVAAAGRTRANRCLIIRLFPIPPRFQITCPSLRTV